MSDALMDLEQLLPSIPAAVERQRVGVQLDRLNAKLADFSNATGRYKAVCTVSLLIGFNDENITDMREAALDAGRCLKSAVDEATLEVAGRSYDDLKAAISAADKATRYHWRTVVTNEYRPIGVVGSLLQKFGDALDIGERMIALAERAERSTGLQILDLSNEIASLVGIRADLEAEKADMTKNGEVDDFLTKLASGRATLSSVTPSVYSWLREHDALDQLAVSSR
ncbi:hypothetical protein [Rhizobium hainanense]|uniref:Uncharacterized protein n=1 Tax=Rhizobium hainanense TaxID=52131 RepID=A0A1C3WC63_9HYPH|nr:hypothetical protein [Rhizobium hainanense]SCB37727.1 hypothetical protein GA0061100_11584 [Rhizobium hainanense]